jgi:hypothetical protein
MLLSVVMARRVVHTAAAGVEVVGRKILALEIKFRNRVALAQVAQFVSFGAQAALSHQQTQGTCNV